MLKQMKSIYAVAKIFARQSQRHFTGFQQVNLSCQFFCRNSPLFKENMPPKRKLVVAETALENVEDFAAGGDAPPKMKEDKPKSTKSKTKAAEDKVKNGDAKPNSNGDSKSGSKEEAAEKPKRGRAAKKPVEYVEKNEDASPKKKSRIAKKEVVEPTVTAEINEDAIPKKKGRVTRKAAAKPEDDENDEGITQRKRGKATKIEKEDKKELAEPKKKGKAAAPKKETTKKETKKPKETDSKKGPLNETETNWDQVTFTSKRKNGKGESPNLTITSWNVDGIRAWFKKDGLSIINNAQPDIICLQETKCAEDKLPEEIKNVEGYESYWCASDKDGYAGVGLLTKIKPINVEFGIGDELQDGDGRCITAEFEKFYVVGVYVPNAGRKLVTLPKRLEWNESFKAYINKLNKNKPVILCGDMNVAHSEIDLANPKTNTKNAGFTQEERDGMTDFLEDGYVDVYRHLHPDEKDIYTFWTYMSKARAKNVGWRLDYFIVPESFMDNVCDILTHSKVFGSDHCPLSLLLHV